MHVPNLLLVSGTHRNVGKTTFICNVLYRFTAMGIVGIKITPHFHNSREHKNILVEEDHVFISEERDRISKKDSALMLQSGADKVYYIEVQGDNYSEIIDFIKTLPSSIPLVCESASLRKYLQPGLMVMIDNVFVAEKKPVYYELIDKIDVLVKSDGNEFTFNFDNLKFEQGNWKY